MYEDRLHYPSKKCMTENNTKTEQSRLGLLGQPSVNFSVGLQLLHGHLV